jgi:prepilin-type N-terminal cleavage/methylation domain-containing protein/prepilin-type processing-associated H-X9-DG protein
MKAHSQLSIRAAFTLLELLVVVAVIALLAALLLPALSHASFQARNILCKNNLRQTGLALQMYLAAYDAYPPETKHEAGAADVSTVLMWDQFLERVLYPGRSVTPFLYASGHGPTRDHIDKTFLCPFFVPRRPGMPFDYVRLLRAPVYGYNSRGTGRERSLGLTPSAGLDDDVDLWRERVVRESDVLAPSNMIAAGDPFGRSPLPSQNGLYQAWGLWRPSSRIPAGWNKSWESIKITASSPAALKIHRARLNRLFCDGHVESENFHKPFAATDEYLRRWNRDNQPHREEWE